MVELQAGPDLDAAIAYRVFDRKAYSVRGEDRAVYDYDGEHVPRYSRDLVAALKIAARAADDGRELIIDDNLPLPLAICQAALRQYKL